MAKIVDLSDLEREWLAAEAAADELKHAAERSPTEELLEQIAVAEQAASDAFDQLWSARGAADGSIEVASTSGLGADDAVAPSAVMSAK